MKHGTMRCTRSDGPNISGRCLVVDDAVIDVSAYQVRGGDHCLLGDSVTEVKQRRARLVLGWVTARKDCSAVRSSVWTLICDRPSI